MSNFKINLQYTTITTPLPDFIYEGLKEYSKNANGYRPQPSELIDKLSQKHGVTKEMIFLTTGADEAIQMLALAFGEKTYYFTPTYVGYDEMKHFFANPVAIDAFKDNDYSIPTEKIPDATLIYLANPNNPFGLTTRDRVIELVKNNPQSIVVIDEVYAEFADVSVIDEVQNYPNLAVLRSFSKSYGMAGNRIGFIVASPEIISKVSLETQFSSVSYLSVGAAMTALDHEEYFKQMRDEVIERRENLANTLTQKGYLVLPSKINGVLIKFNTVAEGTKFADYLTHNNFIISHGNGNSNVGLDKSFVRIAVGTSEEMKQLTEVILKLSN